MASENKRLHDFLWDGLLLLCRDGPAAPNGGCLPADGGCCVEDAYTDGGRAGYPCVLPCGGIRWVLPMPGGRVAKSVANDKTRVRLSSVRGTVTTITTVSKER